MYHFLKITTTSEGTESSICFQTLFWSTRVPRYHTISVYSLVLGYLESTARRMLWDTVEL